MFFTDKKYKFNVTGMHCNHCKASVEKAVNEIEGVKACVADYKKNSLVVKADKNFTGIAAAVISAVERLGFKASL